MIFRIAADLLVLLHLSFVFFVLFGALFCIRWRKAWVVHLPAAAWGVLVEVNQWVCPLTPWEQKLRALSGSAGYEGSFVGHYLVPLLYPPGLTKPVQLSLAIVVLVVNVVIYWWVFTRHRSQ